MSTLPYDYARCPGIRPPDTKTMAGGYNYLDCVNCRRREPGDPEHQSHMAPPPLQDGKCPERIAP